MDQLPAGQNPPKREQAEKFNPKIYTGQKESSTRGRKPAPNCTGGYAGEGGLYPEPLPNADTNRSCVYKQLLEVYQLLLSSQPIADTLPVCVGTWRGLF